MARKKSAEMTAVNFRCSAELKRDLDELAYLSRRDLSSILVELCQLLVDANKAKIANSRRRKPPSIILPTFATMPTAAQDKPSSAEACIDTAKGGDDRAEN